MLGLHYNGNKDYISVNKTEICKFKTCEYVSW